jgi:hypothetical protein
MNPNQARQNQPTIEEQREEFFPAVATFAQTEGSEFAAGPEVREATGLTPQKVWELGYNNLDEFKSDAVTWKAEQDEIAAREKAEQEATAARELDNHQRSAARAATKATDQAAGKAGANAWHKEVAAGRAAKKEADKAVVQAESKVVADLAAPNAKKLSYREKINGLGQVGYDRNPKQAVEDDRKARIEARKEVKEAIKADPAFAKVVNKTAVAMATEKGFATDHLQPRFQPVTMNPAAEARTNKIVEDLKAHQASFSTKARLERQAPTEEAVAEYEAFKEVRAKDAAQAKAEAAKQAQAEAEEAGFQAAADAELAKHFDAAHAEKQKRSTTRRRRAAAFAGGLVARTATGRRAQATAHTARGHASTLRDHASTARARLAAGTTVGTGRFSEWLNDSEKGGNRKALVGLTAATILIAAALHDYKFGSGMGGHVQEAAAAPVPVGTGSSRSQQLEILQAHQHIMGGDKAVHVADAVASHANTTEATTVYGFEVKPGQYPWDVLQNAGVHDSMKVIESAAKKTGLPVEWVGSGAHRSIVVDGVSDTVGVMQKIGQFIEP